MPDDPTILSVLAGLQSTVEASRTETAGAINGLRTELSGRMDQMITRREHEAEVRRQDAETAHVRQALADHEQAAGKRLDGIEDRYGDVLQKITDADKKRDEAREAAELRRRADRRWLVGILIAAVAAASGVSGVVVNALGG
jgi:chromosome segregation ATPase